MVESEMEPAACVGLSAHPKPEIGIFKSLLEIGQIRPQLKREMRKQGYAERLAHLMNFENIKTIQDHELIYTSPKMVQAFDFLLHNNNSINFGEIPRVSQFDTDEQIITASLQRLKEIGADAISVDLTTPDISQFGLSVVRVIITGFQPIHFGYSETRLGGSRIFSLPKKLGYSNHVLNISDLNPFPHPLG
jgi:ribosomal protein S12 methylthiotransferase accessory factor